jgi:type IV pilus assembly protein PilF
MNRTVRSLCVVCALVWLTSACFSNQSKSEVQPGVASEINLRLGTDYMVKGNLEAAKEKIDRALEQNPRNANAHAMAGLLYDRLGDSSKADNYFQRALSLDGKNPEIMNNYAAFLCKSGRYDRGEKYALQAGGNPLYKTPERAYMNAGICQRQAGNLSRAEEHYRRALGIRPKLGGALFEMAELELQQANYMPARAFLERYLEVSKTSPATLWLGVRIERGLGNTTGANSYAARLKNEYPTAVETRELLESERSMK